MTTESRVFTITERDIISIWAAGIFDGEGSALISVHNKGTSLRHHVIITSNSKEIGYSIKQIWGGVFSNPSMGKYTIEFNAVEALKFLIDIRPYIKTRIERVDIMIEALKEVSKLYDSNNRLPNPKKHVQGLTKMLEPYYLRIQYTDHPTKGKQSGKKEYTPANIDSRLWDLKSSIIH